MPSAFEFAANVTVGQYLPVSSFIHRMDPRAKLAAFLALVAAISFSNGYGANLLLFGITMALFPLARVPVRYGLRGLKPALPAILILALMQFVFYGGPVAGALRLVVVSALRFAELIFLTSLLTLTTTTSELTRGFEALFRPFRPLGLPTHELAMAFTIALRFVPTFARELERLAKAQASRGADFDTGGRWRFLQRTRAMLPLFVPLFLMALRRGEELGEAMEARGYVPYAERTHYVALEAGWTDLIAAAGAVFLALLILILGG